MFDHMRSVTFLIIVATATLASLAAPAAFALTKDEIQGLSFLVTYQNDQRVKDAWRLLVERGVVVERPEQQWQLSDVYPVETYPEISAAIVTLQAAKILSITPINWGGSNNQIELLVDDDEIYPRALDMVARAKKTIRFNIFLWGGAIGTQLVQAFCDARDRGVDVKIITAPGGGSFGWLDVLQKITNMYYGEAPSEPYHPVAQDAVAAGLNVLYYPIEKLNGKAFVKADHNKVLAIDGQEALTGGMNFADVIANNHDTMVWLRGPAVNELERVFDDNWRLCQGEKVTDFKAALAATGKKRLDTMGPVEGPVVVTYSNAFINCTRNLVEEAIDKATSKIRVMMFTFTDDRVVEKVIAAHRRGVDVKVLLDPNVHAFGLRLMGAPNLSTVRQLKKAGIEVRAYKTVPGNQMHIKAAQIDDRYTLWGSTNWTTAGFDANNETFVRVESEAMAGKFNALFERDWAEKTYVLKSDGLGRWLLSAIAEMTDGGY